MDNSRKEIPDLKEKVLTISDWCDGPIFGLAYYSEELVIYDRVFSDERDSWTDYYRLLHVDKTEIRTILEEWQEWVDSVDNGTGYDFSKKSKIQNIITNKSSQDAKCMRGRFSGEIRRGFIPVSYYVEWLEE